MYIHYMLLSLTLSKCNVIPYCSLSCDLTCVMSCDLVDRHVTYLIPHVVQLEIYQAFIEEVLRQTSEYHVDYKSLGLALETIQDLKVVSVCDVSL